MQVMQKTQAIEQLGGNITAAAKAIGISYQAVNKWPEVLSPRVADRVEAAVSRLKSKRSMKPRLHTRIDLDQQKA